MVGICVFGGAIILMSPTIHRSQDKSHFDHGSLCNDGSLGFPLHKVFNDLFMVVATFSLKGDLLVEYSISNNVDSSALTLRRSTNFVCKLVGGWQHAWYDAPAGLHDNEGYIDEDIYIYLYTYDSSIKRNQTFDKFAGNYYRLFCRLIRQ